MKKIRSLALAGLFVLVTVRCSADTITEDFSNDPLQNGWQIFGNTNLFQWTTNGDIAVTWDSTQPNSYFYKPLGTILTKDDDFTIEFDVQLTNAVGFGYSAPIAVGFFRWDEATNSGFSRGTGASKNFCEFNFFPAVPENNMDNSIAATLKDAQDGYAGFYFAYGNLPMDPSQIYHVALSHAAGALTINAQVLTNGQLYTAMPNAFGGTLTNFYLDTISISSYQDDGFGDSVLAHGVVDNFNITLPPVVRNVAGTLTNGVWQTQCDTYAGWTYTLQRTTDFQTWTDVSGPVTGDGAKLFLQDANAPADNAFYRVKAELLVLD